MGAETPRDPEQDPALYAKEASSKLRARHASLFLAPEIDLPFHSHAPESELARNFKTQIAATATSANQFVERAERELEEAARLVADWMNDRAVVRIIGQGEARAVAATAARRMATGGARVFVQGEIVSLPNPLQGGGIIAVAVSEPDVKFVGRLIRRERERNRDLRTISVSAGPSETLNDCVDVNIALGTPGNQSQYSASEIAVVVLMQALNFMVAIAGDQLGYPETRWRLGYQDITPFKV